MSVSPLAYPPMKVSASGLPVELALCEDLNFGHLRISAEALWLSLCSDRVQNTEPSDWVTNNGRHEPSQKLKAQKSLPAAGAG